MHINYLFKRILIIFWGLWWLVAFLTDFLGGLKHLNLIHLNLSVDVNYPFLVQSLKQFSVPVWVPAGLFILLTVWLFVSTVLFFAASLASQPRWRTLGNTAYIVSLCFWLALFLSDQVILNFDLEANHMVQGGFQLLSFLAFHLLPE